MATKPPKDIEKRNNKSFHNRAIIENTKAKQYYTLRNNNTYPQDWTAYNQAQTQEKILFLELLYELTSQIPRFEKKGRGRPPINLSEMAFCCCLKTYLDFSSRRTESDIQLVKQLGYIDHVPHFNSILNYLNKPELQPILKKLIEISSIPLKQVEENFTVDASGFSTSMFSRWYSIRQKHDERRLFKKAHIMSGVKTNIITSIEVTGGYTHDSLMFPKLVRCTAKNFQMKEVSADKGYSSRKNLGIVSKCGAIPFIPFRKGVTGKRPHGFPIWRAMYEYFTYYKEEFMRHYHQRSNAESVFSMIKRKQGSHLRTKNDTAQVNEILCKALVHNICVLIQEMFELGIKIDFQDVAQDEFLCRINLD